MNAPDRGRAPEAGPIRPFDFPAHERRPGGEGVDVWVARLPRLPVVSANLFVRAGEGALAEERAGLAVLAGDALEGGTRARSGAELAEALERVGARLEVTTGWEGTSVTLSCMAERLPEGLALLAEAVLRPAFPEGEVERARDQQLALIRQRAMDPGSVANDHLGEMVFAGGVPYRRPQVGTPESVGALGPDALRGYADACWRPGSGGIVVVGDVEPDEAEAEATRAFAGWTGAPGLAADFTAAPASTRRRVRVVDRPGAVQSELRVGHVGVARSHPALFDLVVLNSVFGGSFTSRLNLNLRERNGFTYGVRSRFAMRTAGGMFTVSTAVGTETTAPALQEIVAEMEAMARQGPTGEEIEAARDYIAGVFPLRVQTAGQVAGRLTESIIHDLPHDYHHAYRERVRAVTREGAAQAAAEHLRPEEVQVVVVGAAADVVPAIDALGLGEIEVVTPPA